MWLLSCDGDLFAGKRLWLRPGSTHLLGRTSKDKSEGNERSRYIDHKSVSRKHLSIEVGTVSAGDSTRLHSRPEVKLVDSSKTGTHVNGETLKQETKTLTETEHTIRLGSYEHLFHLSWHPVVLSFASLSKKPGKDALAPWKGKFEQTDVKLALEYVTNETTHVVSKKRNTAASLQALLQAGWVVTDAFADALAKALERQSDTGASLLEDDFDGNWPDESHYITPSGAEPTPRSDDHLKPNPARTELFHDFTFVFLLQAQYDSLHPVVAAGCGKALVRDTAVQSTTVREVAAFVKEVAGHKNSAAFRLSQHKGKGGVVVVRTNNDAEGAAKFSKDLDLALGQQSIEQRDFLDTILTLDTTGLRKQLDHEDGTSPVETHSRPSSSRPQSQRREEPRQQRAATVPDSPAADDQQPPHTQQQPEGQEQPEQPSAVTRRRNRRIVTASRFKGFDDFDPSQFSKPVSQSPESSANNREASAAPSGSNMDVEQPSQQVSRAQQSCRKRPAPAEEEPEDQEDLFSSILPGHAAMKRQKTLAGENGNTISSSKVNEQLATEKVKTSKRKAKDIDVKAEIQARQARRQKEDEERRKEEEAMREQFDEISFEEAKKVVQIEEIELQDRQPAARGGAADGRSDRWDPAWNGRKNFKKFRPQGQRSGDVSRLQRNIVALEEVPRKGHGIGEEYWLNSSKRSNKAKSQSQSQFQSTRAGGARSQTAADADKEDVTSFRRRGQRSQVVDDKDGPMPDIMPDEIAGQARDPEIQATADANSTQTMRSETQRGASGKRPAARPAAGAPATKKAKQSRAATRSQAIDVDDDDDDDALKFRRRKR